MRRLNFLRVLLVSLFCLGGCGPVDAPDPVGTVGRTCPKTDPYCPCGLHNEYCALPDLRVHAVRDAGAQEGG